MVAEDELGWVWRALRPILPRRIWTWLYWFRGRVEAPSADLNIRGGGDKRNYRVLKASYDALVLEAERIDDKLRSLLTALAFLTTAGVSLFVFGTSHSLEDLQVDGRSWNLGNFFFLYFIGCVVMSMSSALVALD